MAIVENDLSTQDRILNSSENLFAELGFDGVSLRRITQHAGVELALANYHFGPKMDLFLAVVRRRSDELNQARTVALEALAPNASVEDVIDAFIRPFTEKSMRGGAGWKSYGRLIAQIANSPRWTEIVMTTQFDPVAELFIERMKIALPLGAATDIYWGFHFLLGAMMTTIAATGRIDRLSNGQCRSSDLDIIHQKIVPFLAAGYRELCDSTGER